MSTTLHFFTLYLPRSCVVLYKGKLKDDKYHGYGVLSIKASRVTLSENWVAGELPGYAKKGGGETIAAKKTSAGVSSNGARIARGMKK